MIDKYFVEPCPFCGAKPVPGIQDRLPGRAQVVITLRVTSIEKAVITRDGRWLVVPSDFSGSSHWKRVECYGCGTMGPVSLDIDEAIRMWNELAGRGAVIPSGSPQAVKTENNLLGGLELDE